MTRLAILADIHGNLPALEAAIADMQQFNVDHVVVAGDIINMGPFSVQVMERVTELGWSLMRGNHELYMLDHNTPRAPEQWETFTQPPWLNAIMPARWKNVIATLPDTLQIRFPDAPPVRVVHGSPRSHWDSMSTTTPDDEMMMMLEGVEENFVIAGHTHLQMDRRVGQWRVMNPGTVGVPLDGYYDADYMIVDGNAQGWRATHRRVEYDPTPIFEEFERIGFVEACGITGLMIVEEFKSARPRIFPFNRWRAEVYPGQLESLAMAREFLALDNKWDYMPPAFRVNMDI
jgi:predicted phosphodiesterase